MKKIFVLAVVIAGIGLISWQVFTAVKTDDQPRSSAPRPAAFRPPVSVEVESVRQAPVQEVQQFTGEVHPSYQYVIAPRVAGRVVEITKRIGDKVLEGEVVVRLDDAEYRQTAIQSEADLRIARAALAEGKVQRELAAQELDRVRLLEEKKIASLSELDKASADYEALGSRIALLEAQVEQREAALAAAKIRLGYSVLTAPRPGHVGERFIDEGSILSANTPIMSVIGINPVIIRTTVVERLYGRISLGQLAEVDVDAYPGKRFSGTVSRIAPVIQKESRVAEMEVEVANTSLLLKPGMFARVRIVLSEKQSAQLVSTKALVTRNGESGVFVIDENRNTAHYVPVRTGIVTSRETEILSPVLEGKVVTLGQHLLEDGSPVILPEAGKGAGG